ncbi:MAG: transporter substrate-binding domain-containing protein [Candidatus Thiodiazotropha sp.]
MFNRKAIHCLLLLLCLLSPGLVSSQPMRYSMAEKQWLNQHQTLHIGVVELVPPMLSYAGSSNPQGLVADYLRAVALHLGLQLEITRYPDAVELTKALRDGTVDVLGAWSPGEVTAEPVAFTRPYLTLPVALYSVEEIPASGLSGLRGEIVAVVEGSVWEQLNQIVPGLRVEAFSDLETALRAAADGRAFAYLGDAASADYLLKRTPIGDLEQQQLDLSYDLALATRSGDAELLSLLQKGLDRIGPDELQEIWHRWPGVERPQQYSVELPALWLWLPLLLAWSALLVWGGNRYVAQKENTRHAKLKRAIRHFQRREKRLKEKLLELKRKTLEYRTESRQHRERLRLMGEVMPSAAWVWEPAVASCQWDGQMFALFRQDPKRFEPTPEAILDLVHEEDRDRVAALFRKSDEENELRISYRLIMPDGEIRWLLDFSNYSIDQTGDGSEQRVGLCWDVTDYLEPELQELSVQPIESS